MTKPKDDAVEFMSNFVREHGADEALRMTCALHSIIMEAMLDVGYSHDRLCEISDTGIDFIDEIKQAIPHVLEGIRR